MKPYFKIKDSRFSIIEYFSKNILGTEKYPILINSKENFIVSDESYRFFKGLRDALIEKATQLGYPHLEMPRFDGNLIDSIIGIELVRYFSENNVELDFSILGDREFWININLFVIPEIIYWRFSQSGKVVHSDRFYTNKRRSYSWYVAICFYLFTDGNDETNFYLLKSLGTDDKVQLIERPRFGYNRLYFRVLVTKIMKEATTKGDDSNRFRSSLFRSVPKLVVFFKSRYSYCFSKDSLESFVGFLINEVNNDLQLTTPKRVEFNYNERPLITTIAAETWNIKTLSKVQYLKKIISQDLDRTASISIGAAVDFFDLNERISEKKVTLTINKKSYSVLIKKRDTRAEFRIFLKDIFNHYPLNLKDILVFTKTESSNFYYLQIIHINSGEYSKYNQILGNSNHLVKSS